ncbi:putative sterigmatocystin 8-O-methyltransferase precursor [Hypoxylon sp. FL0890]|nr:putative sterigmatocystin 8-O-methyltransferase precursor [Hypoxylon sp. FL0890]
MASPSVNAVSLAEKIESIIDEVQSNSESLRGDDRHRLSDAAKRLSMALETPGDTVLRIVFGPLQLPMACIGVETRLFEILSDFDSTVTAAELAERTHVDPALLKRLLRYYQAFGFVCQPGDDAYNRVANNVTKAMTSLGAHVAPPFFLRTVVPIYNILPQFLRESEYADITDPNHLPWHLAHNTEEDFWMWVQKNPLQLEHFLSWMQCYRSGLPTFIDVVNIKQEIAPGVTDSTLLFVDIGGARGHNCIALKRKYPRLPGRVVLQDLPDVIQRVKTSPLPDFEGIEAEPYDFFTPQPLKGARVYYLSSVLHDWPDHKCVEILQNVKVAMTAESKIFIDEIVLPERGTPWRAAQFDLMMLSSYCGGERSYADWHALLDEAGLKILKVVEYTEQFKESVIVAVPK